MKKRDGGLGWYLERIASAPLLTPAEEASLARRLDALRKRHARALLAVPLAAGHLAGLLVAARKGRLSLADLFDPAPSPRLAWRAADDPRMAAARMAALRPRPELLDVIRRECSRALKRAEKRGWEGAAGLPVEEAVALLARADRRKADYDAARKEMASRNLRLVVSVAKRFRRRRASLDDLVQEGNRGLLRAVDRFDWRRGCRFTTYAIHWVAQAVRKAAGEGVLASDESPERHAAPKPKESGGTVADALAALTPRERRLIALRFGLGGKAPLGVEEAAREAGMGVVEARELERKAMVKMRQAAEEE